MENILKKIQEIKDLEGSKGNRHRPKEAIAYARQEFYDMVLPLMENSEYLVIGDYTLKKWYDPPSGKTRVQIFTKESFAKYEEYNQNRNLKWIR